MPKAPARRRLESAAETRRLILETGRALFGSRGYANTTLENIAAAAGVAVATVYTSVGPKPALLAEVILTGSEDPEIAEQVTALLQLTDGPAILARSVASTRAANQRHQPIVELLLTIAPTDDVVGDAAAQAAANYRATLNLVAERLDELDLLAPSLDVATAGGVLWFFLGLGAWQRLVNDAGWSWDKAQEWLTDTLTTCLIRH